MENGIYAKNLSRVGGFKNVSALFAGLLLAFGPLQAAINVTGASFAEDIFGLRVINDSGADNKIFIASDDTFENNKRNTAVPEPASVGFLLGLGALVVAFLRRFA